MNLVWHIIKKDLRRMWISVGFWLFIIAASTIGLSAASIPADSTRADLAAAWINQLGLFAILLAILQYAFTAILVAYLVQEDAPVGTSAFWATRPISGRRLLLAKVGAALLLFVVAPMLVLLPVWLANGFTLSETGSLAKQVILTQGGIVISALAVAALTENLARFLFVTIGVMVVGTLGGAVATIMSWENFRPLPLPAGAAESRAWMKAALFVVGFGFLSYRQYIGTRRPAWVLLATVLAGFIFAAGWSWDLTRGTSATIQTVATVSWEKLTVREQELAIVKVEQAENPNLFYAPTHAEIELAPVQGQRSSLVASPAPRWGNEAAQCVAGLAPNLGSRRWELAIQPSADLLRRVDQPASTIRSRVWLRTLRGRRLWEMPLRAGAEVQSGSSRTRIVGLDWSGEHNERRRVLLHEHDAGWTAGLAFDYLRLGQSTENKDWKDTFLFVDRRKGTVETLSFNPLGVAKANGLLVGISTLEFLPPVDAESSSAWEEGVTLIKVRFEYGSEFQQAVNADEVTITSEKPVL